MNTRSRRVALYAIVLAAGLAVLRSSCAGGDPASAPEEPTVPMDSLGPGPFGPSGGPDSLATPPGHQRVPIETDAARAVGGARAWLTVLVHDGGEPKAGAEVRVLGARGLHALTGADGCANFDWSEVAQALELGDLVRVEATTSDACGAAWIYVGPGEFRIELDEAGYEWTEGVVLESITLQPASKAVVACGPRRVVTSEGGRFGMWLPAGKVHRLAVEVDGCQVARRNVLAGDSVQIVFERRGPLLVRVSSQSRLDTVEVEVGALLAGESTLVLRETFIADGSGLALEGLPAAELSVHVEAEGFLPEYRSVSLGESQVDVELRPAARFGVHFPERADEHTSANYMGGRVRSSATATEGRYAMLDFDPDASWANVQLMSAASIGSGGGAIFGRSLDVPLEDVDLTALELFELELTAPAPEAGRAGQAIVHVEVGEGLAPNLPTQWLGYGTTFGAQRVFELHTDARGRIRILLPRTRLRLTGWTSDGTRLEPMSVDLERDTAVELVAGLSEAVRLRLIAEGEPARGLRVLATPAGHRAGKADVLGVSDQHGLVTLRGLGPGRHTCRVEGPWGTMSREAIEVEFRTGEVAQIELGPTASLQVLRSAEASPAFIVSVEPSDDPYRFPAPSGSLVNVLLSKRLGQGFEVDLAPGRYLVIAEGPAGQVWNEEIHVAAEQRATVVVKP